MYLFEPELKDAEVLDERARREREEPVVGLDTRSPGRCLGNWWCMCGHCEVMATETEWDLRRDQESQARCVTEIEDFPSLINWTVLQTFLPCPQNQLEAATHHSRTRGTGFWWVSSLDNYCNAGCIYFERFAFVISFYWSLHVAIVTYTILWLSIVDLCSPPQPVQTSGLLHCSGVGSEHWAHGKGSKKSAAKLCGNSNSKKVPLPRWRLQRFPGGRGNVKDAVIGYLESVMSAFVNIFMSQYMLKLFP